MTSILLPILFLTLLTSDHMYIFLSHPLSGPQVFLTCPVMLPGIARPRCDCQADWHTVEQFSLPCTETCETLSPSIGKVFVKESNARHPQMVPKSRNLHQWQLLWMVVFPGREWQPAETACCTSHSTPTCLKIHASVGTIAYPVHGLGGLKLTPWTSG